MTGRTQHNGTAVARRAYDLRLDRADPGGTEASVSAFLELLDPEVEFVPDATGEDPIAHRGRERVRALLEHAGESWESCRYEVRESRDVGPDRVLVTGWVIARPPGGPRPAAIAFANLWTLRQGRAVQIESFRDRRDALAALVIPPA